MLFIFIMLLIIFLDAIAAFIMLPLPYDIFIADFIATRLPRCLFRYADSCHFFLMLLAYAILFFFCCRWLRLRHIAAFFY